MREGNNPLVSVIIPTKNSEDTLETCLKSIRNQTYKNIELIVVDNNSSDATKEVAKEYVTLLLLGGSGMGSQVNFAVEKSSGEYVSYFDDDMYLGGWVISSCVEKSLEGFDALVVPENTLHNSFWGRVRDEEKRFYEGDFDVEAARFFKREVFLDVGGFNEDLCGYRDFDLHQKVKGAGYSIGRISESLDHDVDVSYWSIMRKRFNRASTLIDYSREHPGHLRNIVFRKSLLVGVVTLFFRKPIVALGIVFLKLGEYSASGFGLIYSRLKT